VIKETLVSRWFLAFHKRTRAVQQRACSQVATTFDADDALQRNNAAGARRRTHFVKRSRCFFDCAVLVKVLCRRDSHVGISADRHSTDLGEQHGEEGEEGEGEEGREEKGRREEAQVASWLRRDSTSNVVEGLRHVSGMIDKRDASATV
jgi:hypothetical protein